MTVTTLNPPAPADPHHGLLDPMYNYFYDRSPEWLKIHASQVAFACGLITAVTYGAIGRGKPDPARMTGAAISMTGQVLGMVYAKEKEASQRGETKAEKINEPVGSYVRRKLKEGLNPKEHIRETMGLSYMLAGAGYMTAAMRHKRPAEALFASMMMAFGGILSFHKDDRKAWKLFSELATVGFLPTMVASCIESGGDPMLVSATVFSQLQRSLLGVYGGRGKPSDAGMNR